MSSITVGGITVDAGNRGPQGIPGTSGADDAMGPSGPQHAPGAVPDPGATAGQTRFLREDATWAVPAGSGSSGIPEAPNDASTYGRHADGWVGVVPEAAVGVAGGVATLDQTGKVPAGQLPASSAGIAEAPATSLSYVRNNGQWIPKDKIVLNWFWAAYDALIANGTPCSIVVMGDSHTVGQGTGDGNIGGTSNNLANARPYSYTQQMVDYLIAQGMRVTSDSFFGDQNIAISSGVAGVEAYDPRLSIGTGWIAAGTPAQLGGAFWTTNGQASGAFSFQPANTWDQCDVYFISVPGGANEVDVYQGTTKIGQYNCNTNDAELQKVTFTGTLQTGVPVRVMDTAGGSGGAFLCGIVCRNTALPSLEVYQCGWGGAVLANLADSSQPYAPLSMLASMKPNLTILQCTVNDTTAATSPTDYGNELAAIAGVVGGFGNMIMTVGFPGEVIGTTGGPQFEPLLDHYRRIIEATAATGPFCFTDLREIFGNSWASANAKGFTFDQYHANRAGEAIVGKRFGAIVMAAQS